LLQRCRLVTATLIAPERNSFKLREIPEQVLHKIPATFQAAPASNSRDDMVEELTALENKFS
jgi:hypothetical protein